jgi:hypothetical protein
MGFIENSYDNGDKPEDYTYNGYLWIHGKCAEGKVKFGFDEGRF